MKNNNEINKRGAYKSDGKKMMIKIKRNEKKKIEVIKMLEQQNPLLISKVNSIFRGAFYQRDSVYRDLQEDNVIKINWDNNKISFSDGVSIKGRDKLGNLMVETKDE